MMILTNKNKLKKLFLFAFFALIGISINQVNAQDIIVDSLSANKFRFDVDNLPTLQCSCPDRFNEARFTYFWRFGDGGYSKRKKPIYEYQTPGVYNVQLVVTPIYTDEAPEQRMDSQTITVNNLVGTSDWTEGFQNPNDFDLGLDQFSIDESVDALVAGQEITYIVTFGNTLSNYYITCPYSFPSDETEFSHYEPFGLTENSSLTFSGNDGPVDCDDIWSIAPTDHSYRRLFLTYSVSEYIGESEFSGFSIDIHNITNQYLTQSSHLGTQSNYVRTSFDPNMKTVNYDYIAGPETLEYEVHFQNFGEGATNVIEIEDEIHPLLDFDELEFLEVQIGNDVYDLTDPNNDLDYTLVLDPGERTFVLTLNDAHLEGTGNPAFEDCANEFTTGYVRFEIPTIHFDETTLSNGTVISNQAEIIFDSNAPVATETVFTEVDYGNDNCPNGRYFTKTFYDGDNVTYMASEVIYATATTNTGSNVVFDAGKYINIRPGSFLKPGSVVTAEIEGCTRGGGNNSNKFEGVEEFPREAFEGLTAYPNPFQNETKIEFDLEKASNVNLNVYSIEGKHIMNIIDNKHKTKGQHAIQLTEQLNPGVYLLMLETETDRKTFKLLKSE